MGYSNEWWSSKVQAKEVQYQEKKVRDHTLRFNKLGDEVAAIRNHMVKAVEELREETKNYVKALNGEISSFQDNMLKGITHWIFEGEIIRSKCIAKDNNQPRTNEELRTSSLHSQENQGYLRSKSQVNIQLKLEGLDRPVQQTFSKEELTDIYFHVNLVGMLGLIRRTLIQDMFKVRDDILLNYNPHPSPSAGIGQIICPNKNVYKVVEELRRR